MRTETKDKSTISPHPASPCKGEGKIRVAIAMSGGVDSSVAAKLLLDQGYEVVGFMMKLWSEGDLHVEETPSNSPLSRGSENACCDIKGVEDARRVANQLKIPFYLIDARAEFKKHVVDYFIEEYKNLRTPNPCVVCNEKIKFGWLLDFAEKAGCDMLATGHYARIARGNSEISNCSNCTNYSKKIPSSNIQNNTVCHSRLDLESRNDYIGSPGHGLSLPEDDKVGDGNDNGEYRLLKAVDANKDQSYFLYNLNQDQLSKILFPIGQFTKPEVREMAKKWKLPVHEKKESQEICFIKEKDFREFLHRHIPKELFKVGDIVDARGNIIGKHDGLIDYTIGQRKGVDQSQGSRAEGRDKQPLYVVGYDVDKNRLLVGEDSEVYKKKMTIEDVHFIQKHESSARHVSPQGVTGRRVMNHGLLVKIRYRQPAVECRITNSQDTITRKIPRPPCTPIRRYGQAIPNIQNPISLIVKFSEAQRAITPGQSAVFYNDDEVLGGGIIQ